MKLCVVIDKNLIDKNLKYHNAHACVYKMAVSQPSLLDCYWSGLCCGLMSEGLAVVIKL